MRPSPVILLVSSLLAAGGCLKDSPFLCTNDTACVEVLPNGHRVEGRCLPSPKEATAHCAFADPSCAASNLRWHESAEETLAGRCVGGSTADLATADSLPIGDLPAGVDLAGEVDRDLARPHDLAAPQDALPADLPRTSDLAPPDLAAADDGTRGDSGVQGDLRSSPDLTPDLAYPWFASCATLPKTCGPAKSGFCCEANAVPGGTFLRSDDPNALATLGPFQLDRYEVSVGRFRAFVRAGGGVRAAAPTAGSGQHPKVPGSGWNLTWNTNLAVDRAGLENAMKCNQLFQTWTDAPAGNESAPINCVTWYEAMAFCIWDGGRLPSEAEWNFAAAGGSEQRYYPWSAPANAMEIDATRAAYDCTADGSNAGVCLIGDLLAVGILAPKGNGRWGQVDLAGNVGEWTLDYYSAQYPRPCVDCVDTAPAPSRVTRGGGFMAGAPQVRSALRWPTPPADRDHTIGFRCARTP